LADQAAPIALAGNLIIEPQGQEAVVSLSSRISAQDNYELRMRLSRFGELRQDSNAGLGQIALYRNNKLIAESGSGVRLRDLNPSDPAAQAAAYTMVLEPTSAEAQNPSAPGWASGKMDAMGRLTMVGKLGDGRAITASLRMDIERGYRLFLQPYGRAGAYLAGSWRLGEHPSIAGAWSAEDALLLWQKNGSSRDAAFRNGFGPLTLNLAMSRWVPPTKLAVSALVRASSPADDFLTGPFDLLHEASGSQSQGNLPTRASLQAGTKLVAPNPNPSKWSATLDPSTGVFSGSFTLTDGAEKRVASFSGVLRQDAAMEVDEPDGRGFYLLPPLKANAIDGLRSGAMSLLRAEP
jgi:hypothetical protein